MALVNEPDPPAINSMKNRG